jgi:hypothetical protein
LAGASSNIYPFKPRLQGSEGFSEVDKMGQRLGREALRVARNLSPETGRISCERRNRFSRSEIAGILLAKWK